MLIETLYVNVASEVYSATWAWSWGMEFGHFLASVLVQMGVLGLRTRRCLVSRLFASS